MYKLISSLSEVNKDWIEQAVHTFVDESHAEGNKLGIIQQTLENIVHATELRTPGQYFWLFEQEGQPKGYILSHVSKDVDNTLCYWITQAYAEKSVRRHPDVRAFYQRLKEHAKTLFCKHILIPSSRNEEAYIRWLGENLEVYSTTLKEDI